MITLLETVRKMTSENATQYTARLEAHNEDDYKELHNIMSKLTFQRIVKLGGNYYHLPRATY